MVNERNYRTANTTMLMAIIQTICILADTVESGLAKVSCIKYQSQGTGKQGTSVAVKNASKECKPISQAID